MASFERRLAGVHMIKISCICIAILMIANPVMATLIIAAYNNDTIYLAGDSCATVQDQNSPPIHFKATKLFKVSNSSCAALSGNYGAVIKRHRTGQVALRPFLCDELERICGDVYPTEGTTPFKIEIVTNKFHASYERLYAM